ncbi:MAG: FAD-binding protein, partial [Deltaproteobacteria bacterium]|nr:FAD-binding protein [Deltaproteobacteria bacterium]
MREFRKERLAPRTTLGVGGDATRLLELDSEAEVISALKTLRQGDNATVILGEGSNVVIADEGLDAVVLRQKSETITFEHPKRGEVLVHADGGVALDTLVERVVGEGLSGLEGLSGIPGSVGACPVQNVGAYGHQVSDHLQYVR